MGKIGGNMLLEAIAAGLYGPMALKPPTRSQNAARQEKKGTRPS